MWREWRAKGQQSGVQGEPSCPPGAGNLRLVTAERQASRKGEREKCPDERNEGQPPHLLFKHSQDFVCSLIYNSLNIFVPYRDKARGFQKRILLVGKSFFFF